MKWNQVRQIAFYKNGCNNISHSTSSSTVWPWHSAHQEVAYVPPFPGWVGGQGRGDKERQFSFFLVQWNSCIWSPELLLKKIILRQPCCEKAQDTYKTSSAGLLPSPSTRHVSERALGSSQAPAIESSPAFRSPQLRPQTSWSRFTLSPLCALRGFLTHGIHNLNKTFYSTKFGVVCSAAVVTKTSSNDNSQTCLTFTWFLCYSKRPQ